MEEKFVVIKGEDITKYQGVEGFSHNAFPIVDPIGIQKYGAFSHFVNIKWLKKANRQIYGS